MERRSLFSKFEAHDGRKLVGYAAMFNTPATIHENNRTFVELIRPGAFARALVSGADVVATFNHDPNRLLGRTASNTLRLSEDGERGLKFELDLPDHADDIREMVQRGDLKGASFTFTVRKGGEKWNGNVRELTDLFLVELGPVVFPAYPQTSVGLRSASVELMRWRLELAEKN